METIFKHFYPTAVDRYNETGSIKQVCEEEGGGGGGDQEGGPLASGLQVFTKFNPMLGASSYCPPPLFSDGVEPLSLSLSLSEGLQQGGADGRAAGRQRIPWQRRGAT